MVPSRGQFAEWKTARDRGLPEWAFDELMETTTGADLDDRARRKSPADARRLISLFRVQALAWCHFLWSFEAGRYRPKLLACLGRELRGESGPDVFREVFGGDPDETVRAEFEAWVSGL
jgi:hypothetical protein